MTLGYARAEGGARIKMPKRFSRGPKISVIGAISINNIEAIVYGEWNTNGEIFTAYVEQCLLPVLSNGKVVVMDNVGFHCSDKIRVLIESTGAKILFLPPYSPELSPIEHLWSKGKQALKAIGPRTMREFKTAIKTALLEVTKSDLLGWFKHCGYLV